MVEPIDMEQFLKLPAKSRDAIQYRYLLEISAKLKTRRWLDHAEAILSGAAGAIVFLFAKAGLWKP